MHPLYRFKTILELKRYSVSTINNYCSLITVFAKTFLYNQYTIEKLADKDIVLSAIKLIQIKNYTMSSQKQLIGALKLFYKEVYNRDIDFSMIYPTRRTHYLPQILSKEEVEAIIKSIKNCKHQAIIATIYGLGLRISELINLQIVDIDSDRMLVHLKDAKGRKDRIVMLPKKLLVMLRAYIKEYKPERYMFEGQKQAQYSDTSIRNILKKALRENNIKKNITVHSLRHSFATHLLERGTDIRVIQKILGHKNINTTLQYVKVAQSTIQNVQSPIEDILF